MRVRFSPTNIICFLLLMMCMQSVSVYAEPTQTLEKALATYTQAQALKDRDQRIEKFKRSQRLFESAIDQGVESAGVQANLGIAALRAEDLGTAVLAFRRALVLEPNHAQALQNLQHARTLLPSWVPTPESDSLLDSFFFWHKSIALMDRAGLAALFFLVAALLIAVSLRWGNGAIRNIAWLPGITWLILLTSVAVELTNHEQHAVVIRDDTIARAADSKNAPMRFADALPGGVEVKVLEVRDNWMRIGFANGRDAWVARSSIMLVAS